MTTAPAYPPEVYAAFCGPIDQAGVQRVFNNLATAIAGNVKQVHLLFQSNGGFVGDGICIYNYLRAVPIDVTLYNAGSIGSVAVIAYLGAKKRKASAYATFLIHRCRTDAQTATAASLKGITESLILDDQRTEAILRQHINLPASRWADLNTQDISLSSQEAVIIGLADEIAEFSPPKGSQVYSI